jgi:hypothetical protein
MPSAKLLLPAETSTTTGQWYWTSSAGEPGAAPACSPIPGRTYAVTSQVDIRLINDVKRSGPWGPQAQSAHSALPPRVPNESTTAGRGSSLQFPVGVLPVEHVTTIADLEQRRAFCSAITTATPGRRAPCRVNTVCIIGARLADGSSKQHRGSIVNRPMATSRSPRVVGPLVHFREQGTPPPPAVAPRLGTEEEPHPQVLLRSANEIRSQLRA